MSITNKIKDIDQLSDKELAEGKNYYDVDREICVIDGKEWPMFYAKIINKQLENEMPFVLFIGKPGSGKTFASAKLGYDLTNEIGFYDGEYSPDENIHYQNLDFMENLLDARNQIMHKPDINATLNVMKRHEDENQAFEQFIHLARIYGNLITGDAQFLWRCDTGIQITHTFRIVATKRASEYAYDVYYIDREPDAEKKEVNKEFIQRWRPEMPPKEFGKYIKKRDKSEKTKILENSLKEAKGEKEEKDNPLDGIEFA